MSHPEPAPNVIATGLADGDQVVLDTASGRTFRLNRTGAVVWEGLVRGEAPQVIAQRLTERFTTTPTEASEAVAAFTGMLLNEGLLVVVEDDPGIAT